ncbi:MAG: glycosyltransferase [Akkermansiaceae bacterium]|nr:glycosyltransferase [Akkermansiaceae bacterium]
MPARNEGSKLEFALRALSEISDAIVFLDDASTDDSVDIVKSLEKTCNIERIIIREPHGLSYDDLENRTLLLEAGRNIGGTHFIVMDADESFTSNCIKNDKLRKEILKLRPGDSLAVWWIQLWRSTDQYRHGDQSSWDRNMKRMIFCDDGKTNYKSGFAHFSLIPKFKKRRRLKLGRAYGLLHFQFVNWDNLFIKQQWYCWMEKVNLPDKSIEDIRKRYHKSIDESNLKCLKCPPEWLSGYPYFNASVFDEPDQWRRDQMTQWLEEYGDDFFQGLELKP